MGLFLAEAANEGDLIIGTSPCHPLLHTRPILLINLLHIEYVGELIYEATFQTRRSVLESISPSVHVERSPFVRSELSQHLGRSYVFGLNDQMSVDSTRAGNPARFINHAPSRRANVEVFSTCAESFICASHDFTHVCVHDSPLGQWGAANRSVRE